MNPGTWLSFSTKFSQSSSQSDGGGNGDGGDGEGGHLDSGICGNGDGANATVTATVATTMPFVDDSEYDLFFDRRDEVGAVIGEAHDRFDMHFEDKYFVEDGPVDTALRAECERLEPFWLEIEAHFISIVVREVELQESWLATKQTREANWMSLEDHSLGCLFWGPQASSG